MDMINNGKLLTDRQGVLVIESISEEAETRPNSFGHHMKVEIKATIHVFIERFHYGKYYYEFNHTMWMSSFSRSRNIASGFNKAIQGLLDCTCAFGEDFYANPESRFFAPEVDCKTNLVLVDTKIYAVQYSTTNKFYNSFFQQLFGDIHRIEEPDYSDIDFSQITCANRNYDLPWLSNATPLIGGDTGITHILANRS